MHMYQEGSRLILAEGKTQVWIEPWGENSLRVRMTAMPKMDDNDWALTETPKETKAEISFETIDTTDPWYRSEEYANIIRPGHRRHWSMERLRRRFPMRDGSAFTTRRESC